MHPKDQIFCEKNQIQTIEYGLNDTIRMKKTKVIPSDMTFRKKFRAKNFVT